jgi:hypothetical protein
LLQLATCSGYAWPLAIQAAVLAVAPWLKHQLETEILPKYQQQLLDRSRPLGLPCFFLDTPFNRIMREKGLNITITVNERKWRDACDEVLVESNDKLRRQKSKCYVAFLQLSAGASNAIDEYPRDTLTVDHIAPTDDTSTSLHYMAVRNMHHTYVTCRNSWGESGRTRMDPSFLDATKTTFLEITAESKEPISTVRDRVLNLGFGVLGFAANAIDAAKACFSPSSHVAVAAPSHAPSNVTFAASSHADPYSALDQAADKAPVTSMANEHSCVASQIPDGHNLTMWN